MEVRANIIEELFLLIFLFLQKKSRKKRKKKELFPKSGNATESEKSETLTSIPLVGNKIKKNHEIKETTRKHI